MKILMYRWKAFNYSDIKAGFEKMGHQVDEIWQTLENYDVDDDFSEIFEKKLFDGGYDFVFTVNYFGLLSDVCEKVGRPYVCWSCDNPLISMYHESVFNKCNIIFTFDLTHLGEFKSMGVENIFYLPLAVDTNRLDYAISMIPRNEHYSNDISFVGGLYEKNSYDRMEYRFSEYLKGYFEATMEAQRDLYGENIIERMLTTDIISQIEDLFELEKTERSLSNLPLIFSVTTLGFKTAQLQRKSALLALAKAGNKVSIYTGSDTTDLIRVKDKGFVDYWTEMPAVFNQSKINLNLTIPNIKSGIPLRCFDVLGSGGFLLTNFQAEIPSHFEDGKDLVMFYNEKDLVEKAKYYLEHDSEREAIARSGYEKVKANHSYEQRLKVIIDTAKSMT